MNTNRSPVTNILQEVSKDCEKVKLKKTKTKKKQLNHIWRTEPGCWKRAPVNLDPAIKRN